MIIERDGEEGGKVGDGGLWVVEERGLERGVLAEGVLDVEGVVEGALEERRFWLWCDFLEFSGTVSGGRGGEWPLGRGSLHGRHRAPTPKGQHKSEYGAN